MTQQTLIDWMRHKVKVDGVITEIHLLSALMSANHGAMSEYVSKTVDANALLDLVQNNEIHIIEYTNLMTADYRRKRLFYYNPDGPGISK